MPDDLSTALGALNPSELQELHTASYQIKIGKIPGDFNQDRVGKLWDAIQPVVARGGGPERSVSNISARPATPQSGADTRPPARSGQPSPENVNRVLRRLVPRKAASRASLSMTPILTTQRS